MNLSFWLSIVCLFSVALPCEAGIIKQANGAATLEIHFDADGRKLALSDLITVHLTIEGSPSLNVSGAPLDLPANAKWALVERSAVQRERLGADRIRWKLTYRFGPRERGKEVPFAFPEVKFRDGAEQTMTWMPIALEVVSQIDVPDPSKLKSSATIEELPPVVQPLKSPWLWWLLAGTILAACPIAFVLYWFYRGARGRTPVQLALYEYQRLIGLKLPDKGRSERFVTLLTLLFRQYLERQFALPARRQTTPEFLGTLDKCASLSESEKRFLTTLLQQSEAVKFAREPMSVEACDRWAEATRDFLRARAATPPA